MRLSSQPLPLFTAIAAIVLALTTGCSSPQEKRAAFREKMGPPQPTLIATQAFLQNHIAVTAKLGASLPPRPTGGDGSGGEEGGRPGGRPAGGGGGPRRGGGGGGASFPRQALTITLKNTSAESVAVRVQDVVSILGNFVPFPEKATLAPGESITLEAMRGSLANLDELELTIGLAAGADRDRQTFILRRE